jgi:hypothetical protein
MYPPKTTYHFPFQMMTKRRFFWALILFTGIIQSCAPARFVEPLDKKQVSVGGSFGGPLIQFGAPIPIPLTSVDVGYGLDSNLTVFGSWHTTAALFNNAQLEGGLTYRFIKQRKYLPNVSVSPSFQFIYNFPNNLPKIWPVLDLNTYWNYGKRSNYFYVGLNNYFEFGSNIVNEQNPARHWLFNPQIGHVVKGKTNNWQLTAELKFLGPNIDNTYAFIPYMSLTGSRGAAGFFISYRWLFNQRK